jgi:hypothetical protein
MFGLVMILQYPWRYVCISVGVQRSILQRCPLINLCRDQNVFSEPVGQASDVLQELD